MSINHRPLQRQAARAGFTLLEVLVATVIMAIAVVGLLSNLSTSLSNIARLTDYDRASMVAKRTVDDLMTRPLVPKGVDIEGQWDPRVMGMEGGWRARVTPFQRAENASPGQLGLDRYQVEVWWNTGARRKSFSLEAYKAVPIMNEDMAYSPTMQ